MESLDDPDASDVVPDALRGSRYAAVSRRAFLTGMMGAGAGVAALSLLTACGNGDAEAFSSSSTIAKSTAKSTGPSSTSTTARATTAPPATTAAPVATTAAPTTAAPTKAAPTTAAPTTAAPTGATVRGELAVAFTYAASGGRVNNPYVAVWVENAAGELVDTIALWFLRGQKGTRWLPDLRRWYSVDGAQATIDTVSGATRTPGTYNLSWDLTDANGAAIRAGTYFLCIEGARERGPYSLVREQLTLGSGGVSAALPSNGEITNASVNVR